MYHLKECKAEKSARRESYHVFITMAKRFTFFKLFGGNKPKSSVQRKLSTEGILKSLDVPINPHLPLIEDHLSARFRASEDVVRRLIILSVINDCIIGHDHAIKKTTIEDLKDMELWDYVSGIEKSYLKSINTDKQTEIDLTWRTETINVFFWALGILEELTLPIEIADLQYAHEKSQQQYRSITDFVNNAKLRTHEELLDGADFIYRAHWAVRNAQLGGDKMPANFNSSIVYERHYAFNWLTYYAEDWDDITCDT